MSNLKKGEKLAGRAIILESFLAGSKVVIGLLSGSAVLISDAVHSVSDISSIITSWLGLKIAQKKPDEKFPYGYYKAESLGTLIISGLILYAAYEMTVSSWRHLFEPSQVSWPVLALGVSLVDAVVLFFFGQREIAVGEEIGAQSLIAMGKENRTHIFSSGAVFLGTLAAVYNIPYLEGIISLGISLLIVKIGLETLRKAVFALMDVRPEAEKMEAITEILSDFPGVEEFDQLRLRRAGPYIFGEVTVGVRRALDLPRSRQLAEDIAAEIEEKVAGAEDFSVRVQPFESDFRHLVIPVQQKDDLNVAIAEKFGRSPYFLFINLKDDEVEGYYFLENEFKNKEVRAGLSAAKLVTAQKSDVVIAKQIGEITFNTLQNNLFDIYQTKAGTAREAIDLFCREELSLLRQPTKEVN